MRYFALATDYDGTLATQGKVDDATVAALERLRNTGRRLILVSGRELEDLMAVFPQVDLFEYLVLENGALLYHPATREETPLGPPPPEAFVKAVRARGVEKLSVGRVIAATWHPNEAVVLDVIRELGLELQVIFNKGAVMVLPSGINKATGLRAALRESGLSPHNTVAVGDAENDHAMLDLCECAVAVANALPAVKERADMVTEQPRSAGVVELIDRLIATDLRELEPELTHHHILLGTRTEGEELYLNPYSESLLLSGTSGSGKSTLATGVLERLADKGYQFCIIDPEGDYENYEGAVVLGDNQREPSLDEALRLLENPEQHVVINLLGIRLEQRPAFFEGLLPRIQELRARTGRPHWLLIDEAHHLLPASWHPSAMTLPQQLDGALLITVHPDHVAPAALSSVDRLITVGEKPDRAIKAFCEALDLPRPDLQPVRLESGEALAWSRENGQQPVRFRIEEPRAERRRHRRKYAHGELGLDTSFYFRGPDERLNLRAHNLVLFMQLGEGVDDETWLHHLRQGDYSDWMRTAIKDDSLADQVAQIEQQHSDDAAQSRERIRAEIEQRYTAPE